MDLTIIDANDWTPLSRERLNVVPDPMIVRSAELFLKGGKHAPDATWDFLEKNIHALGLFFDTIILEERIPVFDYADTFDGGANFDERVLGRANVSERILWNVHIEYSAYIKVKSAALAELKKLYEGPARIEKTLASDILEELSQAEYQWQPHLGELESLPSIEEKLLARFFLGGLIFGGYAQLLGGQHLLQPKRSRLFLAAALHSPNGRYTFEEQLFADLRSRARSSVTDLPWRPTFLPYLLTVAETPSDVLTEALKLRESTEVKEYREWLRDAFLHWQQHGRLDSQLRDIRAIAAAVDRRTGATSSAPKVEFKVTAADVVGLKPPGSVDLTPALTALWGWLLSGLPGRRYQKLLTRAVASDQAYLQFENRIATVWRNA